MRRVVLAASLLVFAAAWASTLAGASDSHSYRIEMYNAFGLVPGSDVRIAGVNAGSVTHLGITAKKRALVTIETSGPLGVLGKQTHCASEPQSLIAEYFLTCDPRGPPLPEDGTIPASQVKQTVQTDLAQNTLREPFKDRLQLLINEFGTALAGNPKDLNQAIRLGAPALFKFRQALDILASENRTIRDLNANSDRIIAQLANRRQDVVRFIQEARDTNAISATRRADLATDFNKLDDFLGQLHPTFVKLGEAASEQRPLLSELRRAGPGLNTLALKLPAFNRASQRSLTSLGRAAVPGRVALRQGRDEIQALKSAGRDAPATSKQLAKLLLDLDNRKRTVEADPRSPTGKGFTGFENLLNYFYYQAGALNQFDSIGHFLHFTLLEADNACSSYNTGQAQQMGHGGEAGVPAKGGGFTTNASDRARCVSWTGPHQPGITEPDNFPPYDPSVCPEGSTRPDLCNPSGAKARTGGAKRGPNARKLRPTAQGAHAVPSPTAPGAPAPTVPAQPPSAPGDGLPGELPPLPLPSGHGRHRHPDLPPPLRNPGEIKSLLDFIFGP